MRAIDAYLAEFDQECRKTDAFLERLPPDKLDWKPHPKSMSLGQLAWHLATIPARITSMALLDGFDFPAVRPPPPAPPPAVAGILDAFRKGVAEAKANLDRIDDAMALAPWKLSRGGKEIATMPRIGFVRIVLLNHSIHHRGQLSVYLRLLDVAVPSTYGPSADDPS